MALKNTSSTHWVISESNISDLYNLPDTLIYLSCSVLELTKIPQLPPNIYKLWCHDNLLTEIPQLPPSILYFSIYNNPVADLSNLPPLDWIFLSPWQISSFFTSLNLKRTKIVIKN
jgi:hypothetical protein